MTKPFTPKLSGARPKLSAQLNAPELQQFTPRMLAALPVGHDVQLSHHVLRKTDVDRSRGH